MANSITEVDRVRGSDICGLKLLATAMPVVAPARTFARRPADHETNLSSRRFGLESGCLRSRNGTGNNRVASYRLYGLDGVSKVASGEWIEADGDEAAI